MATGRLPAISALQPSLSSQYIDYCSTFRTDPDEAIVDALDGDTRELVCSVGATRLVPLVTTLVHAAGAVPDLTIEDSPTLAAAAETLATATRKVEKLKVVRCHLGDHGAEMLARGLASLAPGMAVSSVLDLGSNALESAGARALCSALRHSLTELQALNLENNPVGDSGAAAAAQLALPVAGAHAPSLRVLSLRQCHVADAGVEALARALNPAEREDGACGPLRVLDVCDNFIQNKGVVALVTSLMNQFTVSVAAAQAGDARAGDAGLRELLLSGNPLQPPALEALAALLHAQAELQQKMHSRGLAAGGIGLAYLDVAGCVQHATSQWQAQHPRSSAALQAAASTLVTAAQRATSVHGAELSVDGLQSLQTLARSPAPRSFAPPNQQAAPAAASSHTTAPPALTASSTATSSRAHRWNAIMQRMQSAVAVLAQTDTATSAGIPAVQAPSSAPLALAAPAAPAPSANSAPAAPRLPSTAAAASQELTAYSTAAAAMEEREALLKRVKELVATSVQAAVDALRQEVSSDVGTLLSEVAGTAARIERLEGVVREEQAATMSLMETLMAHLGMAPPQGQ